MSDLLEYVAQMPKILLVAAPLTPDRVKQARQRGIPIKNKFKQAVACADTQRFQVHHIVPLVYGGAVGWGNLCLIDHELHSAVHRYIDSQAIYLGGGKYKLIIPAIKSKVWRHPRWYEENNLPKFVAA